MITNGKDKDFSISTMSTPNMEGALDNWMQKLTVKVVTKTTVDYQTVETTVSFDIEAVKQQMNPIRIETKPEGQREWDWFTLHTKAANIFKVDDIVTFNDNNYRIMTVSDFRDYGYFQYDMIRGYS